MVIRELAKELRKLLSDRDTELLITGLLKLSVTEYALSSYAEVSKGDALRVIESAKRVSSGEPLQYVVGSTEFMSLPFHVTPSVLIPRQDTEALVENVISHIGKNSARVLDIGSGSGCVAISIAAYCKNSVVTSIDISEAALETARENAELNGVSVNFCLCDILSELPNGIFDAVVSNPPYIETSEIEELDNNVRSFEPHLALDGGHDGLMFYRRICKLAPQLLTGGGYIAFEVGHKQAAAVSDILSADFENIAITNDLCGIQRVVSGHLKSKSK